MQDLLPGMSFLIEHIFCWRSTNWANTPIRQFLSQLAITDGECNPVVYASAAQDPAESIVITQDTRIHVRTPVTRVDENGVLTSASFLMRTNLPVAWSPGQGVLTCAIETVAIHDVTGQEELWR